MVVEEKLSSAGLSGAATVDPSSAVEAPVTRAPSVGMSDTGSPEDPMHPPRIAAQWRNVRLKLGPDCPEPRGDVICYGPDQSHARPPPPDDRSSQLPLPLRKATGRMRALGVARRRAHLLGRTCSARRRRSSRRTSISRARRQGQIPDPTTR